MTFKTGGYGQGYYFGDEKFKTFNVHKMNIVYLHSISMKKSCFDT